jgi:hypothetical protein
MFKCCILFDCWCPTVEDYLLSGLLMGIVKGTMLAFFYQGRWEGVVALLNLLVKIVIKDRSVLC